MLIRGAYRSPLSLGAITFLAGCATWTKEGDTADGRGDTAVIEETNTGTPEADTGESDTGETDSGETDTGETDTGETDAGKTDSGDTHSGDTGPTDADADGHAADVDCDDADPDVHPGAGERCRTAYDDDCDGAANEAGAEDCSYWYADEDGDGHGAGSEACLCAPDDTHSAPDPDDCDDSDAEVFPLAAELCNGLDDDCDGMIDPPTALDASTWYADADADGWGDPSGAAVSCDLPAGHAERDGDCDDADAAVSPDGTERCNGADDDCDGVIDPATSADAPTWYADADADGWGDAATPTAACDLPAGHAERAGDCDDGDAAVSPEDLESCDGADEDCDGAIDEEGVCDPAAPEVLTADLDSDGNAGDQRGHVLAKVTDAVGAVRLAIGNDGYDVSTGDEGRVELYTPDGSPRSFGSAFILNGSEHGGAFGYPGITSQGGRVAIGIYNRDFDGQLNAGAVHIYDGLGTGSLTTTEVGGSQTDEVASLPAFLGDGRLAVGAAYLGAGAVWIVDPTPGSSVALRDVPGAIELAGTVAGDGAGTALASLDPDGDGTADLYVGAPTASTVYRIEIATLGSHALLEDQATDILTGGPGFGRALAALDALLAIGENEAVSLYDGTVEQVVLDAPGLATNGLGTGDFDGDGEEDLCAATDTGGLVYYGPFGGGDPARGADAALATTEPATACVLLDLDLDGNDDLLVGTPDTASGAGRVWVVYGGR